jgi:L-ascorbate metabolism protein UlaG (beta-lactamase superfamily)
MDAVSLKITYLFNSGFLVETANHLLLFDYYRAQAQQGSLRRFAKIQAEKMLQTAKKIFIFASHRHRDHFNPIILRWMEQNPKIRCVLSNDIRPGRSNARLTLVGPDEKLNIEHLQVKTFESTDEGVSFLVTVDGLTVFHAGDLNWWYWWDDSPAEITQAEQRFKTEIAKLKGEEIKLAFFPVDPRLEHNYDAGAKYFIQEIQPEIFIPMHFGEDYAIIRKFALEATNTKTKVVTIQASPQEILLEGISWNT